MKKQIECAMQPALRLQHHTFVRASRWQHVAVLASNGFSPVRGTRPTKATGAPTWSDDSSWILRQRLN